MTTTLTADPARTAAAAILRAVADLIETRPDIPEPGSSISFYLYGPGRARHHGGHRRRPAVRVAGQHQPQRRARVAEPAQRARCRA